MIADAWQTVQGDTSYQVETADILLRPRAVAVDARGIVYITDTGNNRVMRFQLSTELDYSTEN
jgi:sugar lactone lactonase YvrE